MSETTGQIEIGIGRLNWNSNERVSDRYGSVILVDENDNLLPLSVPINAYGALVAIVVETRKSTHVGDMFHGVFPSTPKVGERIVLGVGTIDTTGKDVLLYPNERRPTLWMDIRALYRAHEQTVRLCLEPMPAPTGSVAVQRSN